MILTSFLQALGQLGDPRLRRVLWRGAGLALLLLLTASAGLVWLGAALVPDSVTLPWIGPVGWLDAVTGWALVPLALLLSVVLMAPLTAAMTSLFLDEVADAVEARHHPGLPPVRPMPWGEALRESVNVLGLAILVNLGALALSLLAAPLAPLIFVVANGLLLGREYFRLAALRRASPEAVREMARRHRATIWLAGCLMALPLLVPVVNLLVPTLGAATFTHLFHRLSRQEGRQDGR